MMRLIKKYSNRRMYDTQASRLITLKEIASLIQRGENVQVVDNQTGEDLTTLTLAKVFLEQQKANQDHLSVPFLFCEIIKQGENNHHPIEVEEPIKEVNKELINQPESEKILRNLFNKVEELIQRAMEKITLPSPREWEEYRQTLQEIKKHLAILNQNLDLFES